MIRMRYLLLVIALVASLSWLTTFSEGQEKAEKEKGKDISKVARSIPSLSKVVKGMKSREGFVDLYSKDEKLYGLVEYKKLNKPFFLAISISKGLYAGMQWEDMLVYWKRDGKKLLLIKPDVRRRAKNSTLKDILKKTFPHTVIRAMPIVARSRKGYLINFGKLFKSNLAGVSGLIQSLEGVKGRLNRSLSKFTTIKTFPQNVEIDVDLAYTGVKKGGASWTDSADYKRTHFIGVHYSMAHLPRTNYRPRRADDRVGYFTTAIKDYSKDYNHRSKFDRYIHRWNLKKVDPKLKLSPPKKPIIFYIEKTVPYRFRKYVREGILEWNKAFKKCGFDQAIVVRQQTDSEFNNLDPEDARYNFFRWVTNEFSFAAGPSRVNPLTGEILDADIIFDDGMIRSVTGRYGVLGPASQIWKQDEKFMSMFKKMPGWDNQKDDLFFGDSKTIKKEKAFRKILKTMSKNGRQICMFNYGMKQQMALAAMALRARGLKKVPDEFLGEYVKEIVMHEVGHTLGLYHNFKASSWLSMDKINSKKKPKANVASVMDYNPINFAPKGQPQGHYLTQAIGPYDYWAIEYGYRSSRGKSEKKMLAKIASQSAKDGHLYGNDLYASLADPDPHLVRWDLGDDPIEFAKVRIALVKELKKDLVDNMVQKGENYYPVRRALGTLLGEYAYSHYLAARYVGGMHLNFHHKGDPGAKPPVVAVDAKKQRKALKFLGENIFSKEAFEFDPKIIQHTGPGIHWHWDSDELSQSPTYPFQQVFLRVQDRTLAILLNPRTLWRIHNTTLHVKKGEDVFSMAELLGGLTEALWRELDAEPKGKYSASNPFISKNRRNLQRRYLNIWVNYFALDRAKISIPDDAKTLGRQNLKDLLKKLEKAGEHKNLDAASAAHISESIDRIKEALEAEYIR